MRPDALPSRRTAVARRRRRAALVTALAAPALLVAACAAAGDGTPASPGPAAGAGQPVTEDYRPGLAATTAVPDGAPEAVVVLVPGGGWRTADPTGLRPLADALVADGFGVVTVTYGTSSTGSAYPEPAIDVACAVSYAAQRVPGVPVVAVGHSTGAHLAVLVGLRPDHGEGCEHEAHPADGVVGLAGPYEVERAGSISRDLLGAEPGPDARTDADPHAWADERPDLPVLLVHGEDDRVVDASFSTALAADLEAGGHDVQVELLPGVDHVEVIRPDAVAGLLGTWVRGTVLARS